MKFNKNSLITAFVFAISILAPLSGSCPVNAANERNEIYFEGFENNFAIEPEAQDVIDDRTWIPFGTPSISADTSIAYEGNSSLKASQRANFYDGPAIRLTNMIRPDVEYTFSVMVYQDSGSDASVQMSAKIIKSEENGEEYANLNQISVPSGKWTALTGTYSFPAAAEDFEGKEYDIYIETASGSTNIDFYIDEFKILAPEGETLLSGKSTRRNDWLTEFDPESSNVPTGNNRYLFDFEKDSSSANFISRHNESIMVSNEKATSGGTHSLYVYDRHNSKEGPVLSTDFLETGTRYDFSADVMFSDDISSGEADIEVDLFYTQDDKIYYEQISCETVKKDEWATLSGTLQIPENASNGYLSFHTVNPDGDTDNESEDGTLSFYLDNVTLSDSVSSDMNKIFILIFIITLVAISITILVLVLKKTKGSKRNISVSPNITDKDIMTPTKNKKAYEDKIFDLINHPENCKKISIALCDINHLQYINDNYSREKGDEAVIRCAKALVKAAGKNGTVYRTSGDEFMCISEISLKDDILRELQAEIQNYRGYPFSVASGFACYDSGKDGDSPDIRNIIIRADEALSENKQNVKDSESH